MAAIAITLPPHQDHDDVLSWEDVQELGVDKLDPAHENDDEEAA